jgi:hypothetical protein
MAYLTTIETNNLKVFCLEPYLNFQHQYSHPQILSHLQFFSNSAPEPVLVLDSTLDLVSLMAGISLAPDSVVHHRVALAPPGDAAAKVDGGVGGKTVDWESTRTAVVAD